MAKRDVPFLNFKYDFPTDIIEIEGIKYDADMFRLIGGAFAPGQVVRIINDNGVVTMERL